MVARAGLALALLAGALPPLPGHAASFAPPPGCTLQLTAQLRQCQVANVYTCTGDAPGDRWTAFSDGKGPFYLSRIDAETRWMESIDLETGETDRLEPRAADHASFSALIATGRDDYDFVTRSGTGELRRYRGFDAMTGETVVIDGVRLERVAFEIAAFDETGAVISRREGMQLIHRDWRLFFADTETFENAVGERVATAQPPASFALPGEDGFGAAEPIFDCDVLMTGTPTPTIRPTL